MLPIVIFLKFKARFSNGTISNALSKSEDSRNSKLGNLARSIKIPSVVILIDHFPISTCPQRGAQ